MDILNGRLRFRPDMDYASAKPRATELLESQKLFHVPIILFGAAVGAQIEAQFVDNLDAVVLEPLLPAIGADGFVDALADVAGERRLGELSRTAAVHAAGPLTAEAVARAAGRGFFRRWNLRAVL